MTWTLRKAVPADRAVIDALFVEMLRTIFHTENVKGYEDGCLDRFFSGGEEWICVAQEGVTVVAFLSIEVHREETDYLYLDDLSVTAAYRNRGIGTALIHTAEQYAEQIRIPVIVFHVEKTNTDARRLYERLGYAAYRDDGNRVLMRKDAAWAAAPPRVCCTD